MKIVINFEKKHLYFLLIFLAVIGVGIVIASSWDGSQSHGTLWTTAIKGKNVASITIYDDLSLNAGKSLCLNGVCNSVWPSSGVSATGTIGKLSKFTSVSSLGDSLISESSGVVTVDGNLNLGFGKSLTLTKTQNAPDVDGDGYSPAGTYGAYITVIDGQGLTTTPGQVTINSNSANYDCNDNDNRRYRNSNYLHTSGLDIDCDGSIFNFYPKDIVNQNPPIQICLCAMAPILVYSYSTGSQINAYSCLENRLEGYDGCTTSCRARWPNGYGSGYNSIEEISQCQDSRTYYH